jgi:hypothetical protein
MQRPFYRLRDGGNPTDVVIETMGYAKAALRSY